MLAVGSLLASSGCLEEGPGASGLADKLAEQEDILTRRRLELRQAEAQIKKLEGIRRDLDRIEDLRTGMAAIDEELRQIDEETALREAERDLTLRELARARAKARQDIREKSRGEMIDLSASKGPDYREVRIYQILPIGIKIQLPSGTETIPFEEVPEDLKEKFLMSREEAEAYRERLVTVARARARRAQEKKQRREERSDERKEALLAARIAELEKEILAIEAEVDKRARKVSELQSTASNWELKAARAKDANGKKRAIRFALNYREQASEVAEGNSHALKVVSALLDELKELKAEAKKTE